MLQLNTLISSISCSTVNIRKDILSYSWSFWIDCCDSELSQAMTSPIPTLRCFQPYGTTGVYAYYDGRTCPWHASNWYYQTLALGVATYSIVSGDSALLFDAGLTPAHAEYMVAHVRSLGAKTITTVYSHYHSDHIAGASSLSGTKIIAHEKTKQKLVEVASDLENPDEDEGPSINVVFPTKTYEDTMALQIGDLRAELHNFNIHTADSTLLFFPDTGLLFAGDMLEDTVTYISEPENLTTHLRELERLKQLPITKILPAHGSPERIEAGGFDTSFIEATITYLRALQEPVGVPIVWKQRLGEVVKADLDAGRLVYCEAYEGVHEENVESIKELRAGTMISS